MRLIALIGAAGGAVIGFGTGIMTFQDPIIGIGLALAFGAGIGGVLFAYDIDGNQD